MPRRSPRTATGPSPRPPPAVAYLHAIDGSRAQRGGDRAAGARAQPACSRRKIERRADGEGRAATRGRLHLPAAGAGAGGSGRASSPWWRRLQPGEARDTLRTEVTRQWMRQGSGCGGTLDEDVAGRASAVPAQPPRSNPSRAQSLRSRRAGARSSGLQASLRSQAQSRPRLTLPSNGTLVSRRPFHEGSSGPC